MSDDVVEKDKKTVVKVARPWLHFTDAIGYLAFAACVIIFFLSVRSCNRTEDYTRRSANCAANCMETALELRIDPAPCITACKELFKDEGGF